MCAPFSWNAFLAPSLPPLFRLTPLRPQAMFSGPSPPGPKIRIPVHTPLILKAPSYPVRKAGRFLSNAEANPRTTLQGTPGCPVHLRKPTHWHFWAFKATKLYSTEEAAETVAEQPAESLTFWGEAGTGEGTEATAGWCQSQAWSQVTLG